MKAIENILNTILKRATKSCKHALGVERTGPNADDSPWHDVPVDLADDTALECFLFCEGVHVC